MNSRALIVALGLWASAGALAQGSPAMPSREAIERFGAPRMPTDAELRRVPLPAMPSADRLPGAGSNVPTPSWDFSVPSVPSAPSAEGTDIEAIARRFGALKPNAGALSQGDLLIFVSLSLPERVLAALVDQAARSGATIVMRGLHENSIKRTLPKVREVMGTRKVAWKIDPRLFSAFDVTLVPTFVLAQAGALEESCTREHCERPQRWASVTGNATLAGALDAIARGEPALAREAAGFARALERAR